MLEQIAERILKIFFPLFLVGNFVKIIFSHKVDNSA